MVNAMVDHLPLTSLIILVRTKYISYNSSIARIVSISRAAEFTC